jgi:uncharacterized membrane-anchored protein
MLETSLVAPAAGSRGDRIVDWFKSRERPLLVAGAIAQVVVLVGMIALRSVPFFGGKTVLLKVQPVDPRDMFRGDYVTLSYDFSVVPAKGIPGHPLGQNSADSAGLQGKTVYLALVADPDGIHYHGGGFSLTPPASGLYLRGTLTGWNRALFGIENYCVQEGTGHKYEDAMRSHHLWAEVTVAADGEAAVNGLRIE